MREKKPTSPTNRGNIFEMKFYRKKILSFGTLLLITALVVPVIPITTFAQDPSLPEGALARFENKAGRAGIDFSPTVGNLLAIGDFGRTHLWDTNSSTLQKTLEGHDGAVGGVSFSEDGRTLATMSGVEVYLWDVASGDRLRTPFATKNMGRF